MRAEALERDGNQMKFYRNMMNMESLLTGPIGDAGTLSDGLYFYAGRHG